MKVPNEIKKTVAFLGYVNQVTGELVPVGSVFFLGHNSKDGAPFSERVYAVTAKHVIDSLAKKGVEEVHIRLNLKSGQSYTLVAVGMQVADWFSHPSDDSIDVAIVSASIPSIADHLVLPMSLCATEQSLKENEVDVGDEVFVIGLFRHHVGKSRNIPIVRVGNLATMDEETVATTGFGEMRAYLIEARSIGGLSGSPVFLNLGQVRSLGGKLVAPGVQCQLIGLVHGHYDVKSSEPASADADGPSTERINAGIAIVVPIDSIRSVIAEYEKNHPL